MRRTKDLRVGLLGFVGVLMMCFMFLHFSITGWAAEGKVTASSAKIRKDASTSSDVVGGALQNETYTITGEKTGADGKVWYQITFDGNKTGYIRSDLMQKIGETAGTDTNNGATYAPTVAVTDVQPISATITGSAVRVRSDASVNGEIITTVVRDVVVTITGQATDDQNKIWYRATFSSDNGEVTGFIREDFLSVSGTITPVVDEPVPETPVVDTPVVDDPPVVDTPSSVVNDYEVIEEDGVWFLVDNTQGFKYNAQTLISATKNNQELLLEYQDQIKSQKRVVIVLVILVVALGVLATYLFLKVKDVMDEAYFAAVEKDTIRQRQGQKANNSGNAGAAKSKNVMHTVGGGENAGKQSMPKGTSVPKPATTAKPVQQKPAGAAPQTVKVSNPAETRPKPVQQKPAEQRTAGNATVQKPVQTQQKPAQAQPQRPVQQKPVQQKPAESTGKQSWQSKNFVNDDDDFEFEFLNWDGKEDD